MKAIKALFYSISFDLIKLLYINYHMQKRRNGATTLPREEADRISRPQALAVEPMIGSKLADRYKLVEKIGEGGMGTIYRAEDERLSKKVAVKVLPPYFAGRTKLAERFVQEAKAATRIEHENIIDITDLNVTPQGTPFYVMELLKGRDLASVVSHSVYIEWSVAKNILLQICRAAGAAHKKGVLHCDLKPDNVYLIERGDNEHFVKILDFGIAKMVHQSDTGERMSLPGGRMSLSSMSNIMGSPYYMAPEQTLGREITHTADIYSVGIMMYEMLCGTVPFHDESPMAIMHMQRNVLPTPPSMLRKGMSRDVEAIIMRALEKDPAKRFLNMEDMEIAIANCEWDSTSCPSSLHANAYSIEAYIEMKKRQAGLRKRREARAWGAAILVTALAAAAATAYIKKEVVLEQLKNVETRIHESGGIL